MTTDVTSKRCKQTDSRKCYSATAFLAVNCVQDTASGMVAQDGELTEAKCEPTCI
jgi:hypothetical protein